MMCLPTHVSPNVPTPVTVERTTAVSRKTPGKTAKQELEGTTSPFNRDKDTHDGMSAVRERKAGGGGGGGATTIAVRSALDPWLINGVA